MISRTERPGHQFWLHTETLRLLDFGRSDYGTIRVTLIGARALPSRCPSSVT
jgi:hypothetical protein